ncbi:MAG: S41 family peptidase [Planctomycetes bacterium]|nr:S41 family peptidase [Planctomycetota bacterium]MCB9935839.1 S41 family peptidase [Planctomycetota bacterium]
MKPIRLVVLLALLLVPAVLSAQEDKLGEEAERLIERIAKRPEKAWDYAFALRRLAGSEEGGSLIAKFEKQLDHESESVRMVCSHLVLQFGNPELAYQTWGDLLESEDSTIIESVAMMITAEGPEDEELLDHLRTAWESSSGLTAGARTALCEALLVNQKDELALEQLREFLSSSDHELVGRASLVLSERGHPAEVAARIDSLALEPGDFGRLARIGREVVKIDQAVEDHKSGKFKRKDYLIETEIRAVKKHYADDFFIYAEKPQPLNNEALVDNACRAMAMATDRYAAFMTRKEIDEMNQDQEGNYVGIGAHVAVGDDGLIYITQPIYEGPAYAAGLRTGDKLVGILGPDGKRIDLTKLTLEEGVSHVRGPENSTAVIFVKRRGVENELKFEIPRKVVHVDTALEEMLPGQVGYVRLTRFGGNSSKDMKESLDNLRRQGMKSLVLDLRDNPGGQLSAVIEIADMFLTRDTLISSTGGRFDQWRKKQVFRSRGGEYNDLPMVCLIDENSASGAEMLSGALKDNNRAQILGRASFGKGIGQSFFTVENSGGSRVLKCTVFRYFLPSGISIDRYEGEGGVTPQIEIQPNLLKPWEVYAIDKLRDSGKLQDYLDQHYAGAKKAEMMKLASFDGLNAGLWPEFDKLYASLDTQLAKDDVRRELRYALRARVQDDRGAEFTQNYQEDPGILRSVKELFQKTGQDAATIPEYKAVMK